MIRDDRRKQQLRSIVVSIICPVMLAACVATAGPAATSTATRDISTPTVTETSSPTPPVPASFPVEDATAVYGGFFKLDPAFAGLSSGTYLVAQSYATSLDELLYFTMDGSHYGEIGKLVEMPRPFDDGYLYHYFSWNLEQPSLLFLYSSSYFDTYSMNPQGSEIGSGRALIQYIDLLTGETKVWLATMRVDEKMLCYGEYLSDDFHWLSGNCWKDGENYVYLIDLLKGEGRYLYSPRTPCLSAGASYNNRGIRFPAGWTLSNWLSGENSLWARCMNDTQEIIMNCQIALPSGEFSCQQPSYDQSDYYQINRSPNGTKVAIWVEPNGQEEKRYIFVTDWDCIKDIQACREYVHIPIGYGFDGSGAVWNNTGTRFIWSKFAWAGNGPGLTTVGILDLNSGATTTISAPAGAYVQVVSPDDRWIVLKNDQDLMLLSINGQILRRLPRPDLPLRPGDWPPQYLGWLVIP